MLTQGGLQYLIGAVSLIFQHNCLFFSFLLSLFYSIAMMLLHSRFVFNIQLGKFSLVVSYVYITKKVHRSLDSKQSLVEREL